MRTIKSHRGYTEHVIEMANYEIHIEANPDSWRGGLFALLVSTIESLLVGWSVLIEKHKGLQTN